MDVPTPARHQLKLLYSTTVPEIGGDWTLAVLASENARSFTLISLSDSRLKNSIAATMWNLESGGLVVGADTV